MFIETTLVVLAILVTHIITRKVTLREFDEQLLKRSAAEKRFDDLMLKNKLWLARITILALFFLLVLAVAQVPA